ncbi:unnamed protein product [Cyclocybe aegerita]|uniref:DUF6604 domain-containing protein n=1 Tax=Cyclocybe aegerita TaxID=1973307 RepID=A0A8S0XRU1_CYCAE|nr:unnamed protein product [Cyclocybe aegerita]
MDSKLPEVYYNTYRQYKHANSVLVKWVTDTAFQLRSKMCDTPPDPPPDSSATVQRRKPRDTCANRLKTGRDLDPASPKVSFTVFLELVEDIAESNVFIPQSYVSLLELSIKQRKQTAAFYSPDENASEVNKSHEFAIDAYSQALSIFKEAKEKSAKNTGASNELKASVEGVDEGIALNGAIHNLPVLMEDTDLENALENEWLRDNPSIKAANKKGKAFPWKNINSSWTTTIPLQRRRSPRMTKKKASKLSDASSSTSTLCASTATRSGALLFLLDQPATSLHPLSPVGSCSLLRKWSTLSLQNFRF